MCRPGLTVEEFLAAALPIAGPIRERIATRLSTLDGDLIVDPVDAGLLYKHDSTFTMLRSKTERVALSLHLPRQRLGPTGTRWSPTTSTSERSGGPAGRSGGDQTLDGRAEHRLGLCTDHRLDRVAVAEEDEHRDAHRPEALRDRR